MALGRLHPQQNEGSGKSDFQEHSVELESHAPREEIVQIRSKGFCRCVCRTVFGRVFWWNVRSDERSVPTSDPRPLLEDAEVVEMHLSSARGIEEAIVAGKVEDNDDDDDRRHLRIEHEQKETERIVGSDMRSLQDSESWPRLKDAEVVELHLSSATICEESDNVGTTCDIIVETFECDPQANPFCTVEGELGGGVDEIAIMSTSAIEHEFEPESYVCMFPFDASEYGSEYASLHPGDDVEILRGVVLADGGWAFGRVNGSSTGWFPADWLGQAVFAASPSKLPESCTVANVGGQEDSDLEELARRARASRKVMAYGVKCC